MKQNKIKNKRKVKNEDCCGVTFIIGILIGAITSIPTVVYLFTEMIR